MRGKDTFVISCSASRAVEPAPEDKADADGLPLAVTRTRQLGRQGSWVVLYKLLVFCDRRSSPQGLIREAGNEIQIMVHF